MAETNSELESFRQQWKAEVSARSKAPEGLSFEASTGIGISASSTLTKASSLDEPPASLRRFLDKDVVEAGDTRTYNDLKNKEDAFRIGAEGDSSEARNSALERRAEPVSALEHFERAVEREDQGNLGDSLGHYRKAYRVCSPSSNQCALL
jgi:F-box protein 9